LQKKRSKKNKKMADLEVLMGCASIHLWSPWALEYMPIPLRKSNKGWHKF
jgi:hypothetical protein